MVQEQDGKHEPLPWPLSTQDLQVELGLEQEDSVHVPPDREAASRRRRRGRAHQSNGVTI